MTGGQFSEVDLDLLADYVGGALAGTPDEAVVARLIVDDPAWARAHTELAPTVEAVSDRLADWGVGELPMPADVTDRLTRALAAASSVDQVDARHSVDQVDDPVDGADSARPPRLPAPRRRLSAVPDPAGTAGSSGRSTPTRRRLPRWVAPVTVAAALAALAGSGLGQAVFDDFGKQSGGSSTLLGPAEGTRPRVAAMPAPDRVLRSGTDYTRATLARTVASPTAPLPEASTTGPTVVPFSVAPAPPSPMSGSSAPQAAARDELADCLNAVAEAHGRGPIVVELVDYATFEGLPALVIRFVDARGERWAWVAGPDCGGAESGADTDFRTRVG